MEIAVGQKTLYVTCQEVVVFNSNELGIYNGFDNIGLGVLVENLVSVEPVDELLVELHVHVPNDYEVPPGITQYDLI